MKISVIGVGGVGGYFGAKLAKAGNDVTFIARGNHLKVMQENGLEVKSILGDFKIEKVNATSNIVEIENSELIIIAVKAWQVKDIAKQIAPFVNEKTSILPLQNGVVAAEELKEFINERNIIGGLCRIVSKIEAPGVIHHFAVDPTIIIGELNNLKSDRVEIIYELLRNGGIGVKISSDIMVDLWKKFLLICTSGLLAITKQTYGEMRELKETRQMMINIFNEIYMLSQKIGINIESDFISKTITLVDAYPHNTTSSLTRDVWEGKPSEIEYQNGTVVRLGQKYGVETPVNNFIYSCILPLELKARKNQ